MVDQKVKVLYIGSLNRSGSTLVTKYLNEIEGFFSVNEIVFIGLHGLRNDFVLGNGEKFSENTIWQKILKKAYGTTPHWQELAFFENNIHKDLGLPGSYLTSPPEDNDKVTHYQENIAKLYQAIVDVTQCKVIVDSSKSPDYAYLLATIDLIDLRILHLTRDFRGVYFSHTKKVQRKDVATDSTNQVYMRKSSLREFLTTSYLVSIKFFLLQRKNIKYLRLRYEDFCRLPEAFTQKVLAFVDTPSALPAAESQHQIRLKEDNLGIWGNPMRMENEIRIRQDQQWKDKLPTGKKAIMSFFLAPLAKLYGY